MEKRKFKVLLSLFLATAVMFAGCSSDDGDDDTPPENSVSIPKYSPGKILKNKVISSGSDVYYEYLTFESETGGTYALYKDGAQVTSYTNKNGESVSVPSSFTYDAATGKFSAGDVSSYMFNAKKNGKEVSVIASEEMTCSQEKPALLAEWKSSSLTFKFTSDDNGDNATVTQKDGSYPEFTVPYTNDGGWITVSNFPLFFSSSNRMFYLAYVTERTEVEAVGRNASYDELNFVSPVFILADIQL